MQFRSTTLKAAAMIVLGGLLGYGAACADLFRNASASVISEPPNAEGRHKPTLDKKSMTQADQQLPGSPKPPSGKKPNIVYFQADNLGYGELGCYARSARIKPCLT
jgi:hypothetical protein